MASQPSLRIGDRERDAVMAELREHFAHGRLTQAEFTQRLDAVFSAKTQADLRKITSDLPHIRPAGPPLPSSRSSFSSLAGPAAGNVPVPVMAQHWTGNDWSGRRHAHRHGGSAVFTLLAAVAAWLLVYDVILVGLRVPWAGRVGLLVAIFTVIRALLRRIFRIGVRRR
jgi:Domain of unknown function (DUF1707)